MGMERDHCAREAAAPTPNGALSKKKTYLPRGVGAQHGKTNSTSLAQISQAGRWD